MQRLTQSYMKVRLTTTILALTSGLLSGAWGQGGGEDEISPTSVELGGEAAQREQAEPCGDGDELEAVDGTPESEEGLSEVRKPGEVPAMFRDDSKLDDSLINQELGINIYTAPSISKIFNQLDNLPAIPEEYVLRERPEKLSTEPGQLALEMGYLMADGFIAVRSGHMNDIKPIALELARFGKALGVGDRMNAHSASLLENAEKGQIEDFKRNLANTQEDVNAELVSLRDPDLAHLIALGGWIRALQGATAAIGSKFDARQALVVFYPDGPTYFSEILSGLNPQTAEKMHVDHMLDLLKKLAQAMELPEGALPTAEQVETLRAIIQQLTEATTRVEK